MIDIDIDIKSPRLLVNAIYIIRKNGKKGKRKRGIGVSVPSRQTLSIGKKAMRKLRHFCVDTELRPNDVVEAMILREDFDENGTSLLDCIEKNRNLTIREESR